jgi:glutamyl-tRNA synthetase
MEDIDGPRLKKGADLQAIEDLRWLGLDWDSGPDYQSGSLGNYRAVVSDLLARGMAYPCACTRAEVDLAASAPHASDGASVYPGTCRGKFPTVEAAVEATGRLPCIRFRLVDCRDDGAFEFVDGFRGHVRLDPAALGDFVIQKSDGTPSYQLACALDDAASGITRVVRGDDLLDSTPRQLALMSAMGFAARPTYCHVPLVLGSDGLRLAKRHGDTRVATYREVGATPDRVLSLLARWCGIEVPAGALSARDLISRFDLARVPRGPVTFTAADDAFLRVR